MMELYHIFRFVKGRCHGNQIMLGEARKNEGGLIPRAFSARLPRLCFATTC